jgi:hypothetical protein
MWSFLRQLETLKGYTAIHCEAERGCRWRLWGRRKTLRAHMQLARIDRGCHMGKAAIGPAPRS